MKLFLTITLLFFSVDIARAVDVTLELPLNERVPYRIEIPEGGTEISVILTRGSGFQTPGWPFNTDRARLVEVKSTTVRTFENGWVARIQMDRAYELRTSELRGNILSLVLVGSNEPSPVENMLNSPGGGINPKPLIVLDPGHGGIDSGAVRDETKESDLMLSFARELAELLVRTDLFRVMLTREGDEFLRLSERIDVAQSSGADAFISLHADALLEGKARGAAAFTLSKVASTAAAQELVEAHDRADLLQGQVGENEDDDITAILIEMAQRNTSPRSIAFADAIVAALAKNENVLRKQARRSANFGVLKAPDIPSVLVELGFMSDEGDLQNLMYPEWRSKTAAAMAEGIVNWANADEAARLGRN